MAVTIRVPGTIDLTDQRIQVGDTVAFVEKMNATQQKLEAWTSQDWNNFVADVSAAAQAISTDADGVALAAQQVATNAQQVATDRNQVAANAQQVAEDLDDIEAVGQQVSANAQQVATNAQQVAVDRALVETIKQEIVDSADIKNAVEAASGGRLTVRLTDKGQPCVFLKVPAFNCEDVAPGGELGMGLHPAFVKNGSPVPYILVGQHIASYSDAEVLSRAGVSPAVSRTYDQELAAVAATGQNFRQLNNLEWAAVTLWCMANGYEPLGNTYYGRHHTKRWETGVRSDSNAPGAAIGVAHTLTGSGPGSWHHDGTAAGISDMVGNVWERVSGMKLIDGVFHIAPDGGDYLESAYVNTGFSAPAEGTFSSRPTSAMGLEQSLPGWSGRIDGMTLAANGYLVAVGYAGKVCRSADGGISWGSVTTIPGFSESTNNIVTLDNDDLIVVGANGVYSRSSNNGATWVWGLTISGFGDIYSIAQAANGDLVAVGDLGRYVRSTDNGATWGALSTISGWAGPVWDIERAANGDLVVVGGNNRYSRSTDNGLTWSAVAAIPGTSIQLFSITREDGGALIVGAGNGMYSRSLDNGVTWTTLATMPGLYVNIYSISTIPGGGLIFGSGTGDGKYCRDFTIPLRRALCIPAAPSLAPVGNFYRGVSGERIPLRGGSWVNAGYAGLGALVLNNARSGADSFIGLRLAYRDQ